MLKSWLPRLTLASTLFHLSLSHAQVPGFAPGRGERIEGAIALARALKASTLTIDGRPFHAIMEIGNSASAYSGRVEVWWIDAGKYRVVASSPGFSQRKIVNGDQVEEQDKGDYYPRWLEEFVLAVIDPVPMANNFRGGAVMVGAQVTNSCLRRDDRPEGMTDQLTWGQVCFTGSEPRFSSVLTFNHSMDFRDWKGFEDKQIARTYETDVLDYQPVVGRLTKLEKLAQPDEAMFAVSAPTPKDQQISTELVSTLTEESLIERAPAIEWPPVREGKTEGYMIVYARTDRTGQVRETAKHNSDQPGLESFGMEQALQYKFKPLIVDGVALQMEMPLVLHFSSKIADPLPILSVADMKKQMLGCKVDKLPRGTPTGTVVQIRVSVDETGKVTGMGAVGPGGGQGWLAAVSLLRGCQFAPYVMNGKATYYKGDVELVAP